MAKQDKLYIVMEGNVHPDQISGVDYALLLGSGVSMRWENADTLALRIPVDDLESLALIIGIMEGYGFRVLGFIKGMRD